jgi:hypothetical protein
MGYITLADFYLYQGVAVYAKFMPDRFQQLAKYFKSWKDNFESIPNIKEYLGHNGILG